MHSKTYITVRYAETDRMGIAHHSNYPVWYEVGRTDFVKMFGFTYSGPATLTSRRPMRTS